LLVALVACSHPHAPPPPPADPPEVGDDDPHQTDIKPAAHVVGEAKKFGAEEMCVTHGSMHGLHVAESSMRAFARGSHGDSGTLSFTYDGPTKKVSHLASGDVREQLGLKLRAEDGCNLVYVMWRFSPKPEVVVQVKRNAGKHTNDECGTNGYERVKPSEHAKVPVPDAGSQHVLAATIDGDDLVATVDDKVVWRGTLPASARDLHGPIGVRTDNVEASIELSGPVGERDDAERCRSRGAD